MAVFCVPARSLLGLKPTIRSKAKKTNPHAEWDPQTGVLYDNPDPEDAKATTHRVGRTIGNSGVINYLNKFSQMETGKNTKGSILSVSFTTRHTVILNAWAMSRNIRY